MVLLSEVSHLRGLAAEVKRDPRELIPSYVQSHTLRHSVNKVMEYPRRCSFVSPSRYAPEGNLGSSLPLNLPILV